MIGTIEGSLGAMLPGGAIIEVGGIGYRIQMTVSGIARLPRAGERIRLHTHLHVREDALTLYGFLTSAERDLFETLLGVSGIGPKAALAVLGVHAPDALRRAVAAEDLDALTLIPGVGRKTAQRMLLELRERLGVDDGDGLPGGLSAERRATLAEVRDALASLGYTPAEIRGVLGSVTAGNGEAGDPGAEALLKQALKELASA